MSLILFRKDYYKPIMCNKASPLAPFMYYLLRIPREHSVIKMHLPVPINLQARV